MKKVILMMLILGLMFSGFTGDAQAEGWGKATTIIGYYVWDNGSAHFRVASMENPDGCTNPQYLTLDATAANFKENYATLIIAHNSGDTVQLSYNGCTQGGLYPLIKAIAVPSIW